MDSYTKTDCFAKGTEILTPAGNRRVEDIRIGDVVCTPDGTAEVINIFTGFESGVMRVDTDKGHSIMVTGDHPILLESGFTRANRLQTGDVVMVRDGTAVITAVSFVEYEGYVYSLETHSKIIANGFITGDFATQISLN